MDLGIEVILELFTKKELTKVFNLGEKNITTDNAQRIFSLRNEYLKTIDQVIHFLQGKAPTFARQICTEYFLPRASRFRHLDDMEFAFGNMGMQDKAKHLATLYLEDLSDFIIECLDPHFGFSRYAERLGRSANSFNELYDQLQKEPSFIDNITIRILENRINKVQPKLICFSVPFPGNLYSAFRCALFIKNNYPNIKTAMGGGFPNTELRSLKDKRVFDFFDFITLDDGELPIELLHSNIISPSKENPNFNLFKRTYLLEDGDVFYNDLSLRRDYPMSQVGTPDYSDLLLDQYVSAIEIANPMHSLWSDGRWNKLTMAHGCYWGKCTFCDVSLDYIGKYEPVTASLIVDRMEEMVEQTGERGFHFVDEAAPPALMRDVALEIIRRGLIVTWWTNIRFEKSFTEDLCRLLKASGCVAVSGGLEVASDRLLALIKKGVTVEQVARVCANFKLAGIMVHAYLMYGYPTQTEQETVDSLEMVRQMFELDILQSGFWHQFALTAHSPVGLDPDAYGIIPEYKEITFADNDVAFKDSTGINHDKFSYGLKKSLFNYMHGACFEFPLQEWFDFKIPRTTINPNFIDNALEESINYFTKETSKVIFIGTMPNFDSIQIKKRKKIIPKTKLTFHTTDDEFEIILDKEKSDWIVSLLKSCHYNNASINTFKEIRNSYENTFKEDFELFWYEEEMDVVRAAGLLIL